MKTLSAAALAAVLALTVSGCGNNDDATASKNLSASILKAQKSGGNSAAQFLSLKKKEADCIGSGFVDKIGTDQLKQYKLLDKNLKANKDLTQTKMSAGDAKSATDVLFGCTDVPGMMKKAIASSGQVPATMQPCVNKALTETTLRGMFTEVFKGNQNQAQKKLIAPMMKCAAPTGG